MFKFQQLYYALQVIRYYVHQYEPYMCKKLMKSFQHELFIQNTSVYGHNNSNTAEDYLNIYITSALYTQKIKIAKTSSRYKRIAPPC